MHVCSPQCRPFFIFPSGSRKFQMHQYCPMTGRITRTVTIKTYNSVQITNVYAARSNLCTPCSPITRPAKTQFFPGYKRVMGVRVHYISTKRSTFIEFYRRFLGKFIFRFVYHCAEPQPRAQYQNFEKFKSTWGKKYLKIIGL